MSFRTCIGNLIGLREDFAERYLILHQYTFPPVLERIARSNIANYTIFHLDGILFGVYDYQGSDYVKDMQSIAEDPLTKQWWKLTEPMQQPLSFRKSGEWWATLEHHFSSSTAEMNDNPKIRKAFRLSRAAFRSDDFIVMMNTGQSSGTMQRVDVYSSPDEFFLYLEISGSGEKDCYSEISSFLTDEGTLSEMREVFHTDGCNSSRKKKVFVTGCFDMLHSGHIAFLKEASSFGDLYVGIGSDANVGRLKGRFPVNTETERKYMLESIRYVFSCMVNKGWGLMDFLEELDEVRPDIFIVNEDGHTHEKEVMCRKSGIEYRVLRRLPDEGLPVRSTTVLRMECRIPFRIDLAGGWLDQPFVSKYFPGPVLTISIEPTLDFNDRSGMASSTRRKAIELWQTDIPPGDPGKLARILFSYDNPPGTADVSGSQDALGIVLPGLNRLDYDNGFWPVKITSVSEEDILNWIENHLYLITLGPRTSSYTVVDNSTVTRANARALSEAADRCWNSILAKDMAGFGKHVRESFEAQVSMFPNMADEGIYAAIRRYQDRALGWKLSGAGGGGYLILVSEKPVEGAFKIRIRRKNAM